MIQKLMNNDSSSVLIGDRQLKSGGDFNNYKLIENLKYSNLDTSIDMSSPSKSRKPSMRKGLRNGSISAKGMLVRP